MLTMYSRYQRELVENITILQVAQFHVCISVLSPSFPIVVAGKGCNSYKTSALGFSFQQHNG